MYKYILSFLFLLAYILPNGCYGQSSCTEYLMCSTCVCESTPPTINDINKVTENDTSTVAFSSSDFTDNFRSDGNYCLKYIKIVTLPSGGTLTLSGTPVTIGQEILITDLNNLIFTPQKGWDGSTNFQWNGYDGAILNGKMLNAITPAFVVICYGINCVYQCRQDDSSAFSIKLPADVPSLFTCRDDIGLMIRSSFANRKRVNSNQYYYKIQVININGDWQLENAAIFCNENMTQSDYRLGNEIACLPGQNFTFVVPGVGNENSTIDVLITKVSPAASSSAAHDSSQEFSSSNIGTSSKELSSELQSGSIVSSSSLYRSSDKVSGTILIRPTLISTLGIVTIGNMFH